jgi:hypothetical protein
MAAGGVVCILKLIRKIATELRHPSRMADTIFDWLRTQSAPPVGRPPSYYWWLRIAGWVLLAAMALIASSLLWVMTTQTAWYYGGPEVKAAARAAGGWRATGVLVTRARFALLLLKHGFLISFLAWFAFTGKAVGFGGWLSKRIKARPPASGWRAKLPERFRDRFRLRVVYIMAASLAYGVYVFVFDLLLYALTIFFAITNEHVASVALRSLLEVAVTVAYVCGAGFVLYLLVGLFPRDWLWPSGIILSPSRSRRTSNTSSTTPRP